MWSWVGYLMRMPTYTHACVACWKLPYILVCTAMSPRMSDLSDGEVSSDGELVEEVNLHRVCEFFVCCTLVVAIAFTTGEVKNANIASDYPRCRNESADASVSL